MFKLSIKPSNKDIEVLMDRLIAEPLVIITDDKKARRLGIYAKPLRDRGVLHISPDAKLKETVAFLKCNNYYKANMVKKKKGKRIDYEFNDLLIPKIF